jgi:hypothetical protein
MVRVVRRKCWIKRGALKPKKISRRYSTFYVGVTAKVAVPPHIAKYAVSLIRTRRHWNDSDMNVANVAFGLLPFILRPPPEMRDSQGEKTLRVRTHLINHTSFLDHDMDEGATRNPCLPSPRHSPSSYLPREQFHSTSFLTQIRQSAST